MGYLTIVDGGHGQPGDGIKTGGRNGGMSNTTGVGSIIDRVTLGTLGLSMAAVGLDSAFEARDGMEVIWLAAAATGLAFVVASVRGRCRPFTRLARLLRLPPMA
jgi:hypothetical protein